MEVVILPTPADCGRVVADVLAAAITGRATGDRPTLGLATGSSPVGTTASRKSWTSGGTSTSS